MKLNKKNLAVYYAEKSLEVDRYCVGEDHPDYEKRLGILNRMKLAEGGPEPFDVIIVRAFPHAFSQDEFSTF